MLGELTPTGSTLRLEVLRLSQNSMPELETVWRRVIWFLREVLLVLGAFSERSSITAELGSLSMVMMLGGLPHASPSTCTGRGERRSILS